MPSLPRATLAHAVDAAVPLPLLVLAAGLALAAVARLLGHRRPALRGGVDLPPGLTEAADARAARVALSALGVVAGLYAVAQLVAGTPASSARAAGWLVSGVWVPLVIGSLLLGPVWRLVNPLRPLAGGEGLRPMPDRLGWWPAAAAVRASATFARIHASFVPLKYGSSSRPVLP
jgi:hypothetical protein